MGVWGWDIVHINADAKNESFAKTQRLFQNPVWEQPGSDGEICPRAGFLQKDHLLRLHYTSEWGTVLKSHIVLRLRQCQLMKIKISYCGLSGVTSEDFKWWEAGSSPPWPPAPAPSWPFHCYEHIFSYFSLPWPFPTQSTVTVEMALGCS